MHLVIRNHICYFRLLIPKDCRELFGCREIRRSLGTCDTQRATLIASILAYKLKDIINMAAALTPETIKALVDSHIKSVLEAIDLEPLTRSKPTTLKDAATKAEVLEEFRDDHEKALITGDFSIVSHIADRLCREAGIREPDPLAYKRFCRELLQAVIKLHDVDVDRTLGDYDTQRFTTPTDDLNRLSLGELVDKYKHDKREQWSPSTRTDYETISRVLLRFMNPETQVSDISRRDIRDYKEVLKRLPPRFISQRKYDRMGAAEVKALGLSGSDTVSAETINKNMSFMTGLFSYAVDLEYIGTNPASNMKEVNRQPSRDKVGVFTPEDITRIFTSPDLGKDHPYQFWVPVLGLFTGARREELCSLYGCDIKNEGGVWYLDINEDKPDKRIKTHQGRKVPLHSFVVDLGFIEYCRVPGRIFPELTNKNRDRKYGHYFGKWFNGKLLAGIKPTEAAPNKTFHSFRHTLITQLINQGLPEPMIKAVVGHDQGGGVTMDTYFKGFTIKVLYDEVISKIDHGIDLEHLKRHKHTNGYIIAKKAEGHYENTNK